jgi:hypothetical protein
VHRTSPLPTGKTSHDSFLRTALIRHLPFANCKLAAGQPIGIRRKVSPFLAAVCQARPTEVCLGSRSVLQCFTAIQQQQHRVLLFAQFTCHLTLLPDCLIDCAFILKFLPFSQIFRKHAITATLVVKYFFALRDIFLSGFAMFFRCLIGPSGWSAK